MHTHEYFMQQCLELAGKGLAQVAPNPMVGAVLVYHNQIIGKGYHQQYGQAHAEVHCLNSVLPEHRNYIPDSTLYVSLEPCSHFGKTPPCCHRILEEGIRKVVIATQDPNPEVHGRGVSLLREQGVEVIEGICSEQARFLNRRFFTFHEKQRPYLVLKWAESVEGYIGKKGERIQLSGEETHRTVHRWRSEEQAIWVGYETARNDNPQLNVRLAEGKHPLRLVFDRDLSLPSSLHLFQTAQPTLCFNQVMNRKEEWVEWIKLEGEHSINEILRELYRRGILSVLVEGGRALLQQLIDQQLWDEIRCIQTASHLNEGVAAPVWTRGVHSYTEMSGSDQLIYDFAPGIHP